MNYEALVPNRELCEELACLGICQDGAELCWVLFNDGKCELLSYPDSHIHIIAPTLPRMLEELPYRIGESSLSISKDSDGNWWVSYNFTDGSDAMSWKDKQPSDAVARALIAVKEAK